MARSNAWVWIENIFSLIMLACFFLAIWFAKSLPYAGKWFFSGLLLFIVLLLAGGDDKSGKNTKMEA